MQNISFFILTALAITIIMTRKIYIPKSLYNSKTNNYYLEGMCQNILEAKGVLYYDRKRENAAWTLV